MDFYNNEFGRQLGLVIKNEGANLTYDQIADVYMLFIKMGYLYYRIENDGTSRTIHDSRPIFFDQLMDLQ